MSEATKGKQKPWLKGKKRPEVGKKIADSWTPEMKQSARIRGLINAENTEWLLKIAESVSGKNNPNYQGKGKESPYSAGWGKKYRKKLRERKGGKCSMCLEQEKLLDLHHIDFSKTNHHPDNIQLLCRKCHKKVHVKHMQFLPS